MVGDMSRVVRDKRMGVSASALFDVICDYESYPEFLPEVVSAKILSRNDTIRVEFALEVIKRFSYELEFTSKKDELVNWRLVKSNFFKENAGQWLLKPENGQVNVHYELQVEFGFLVPSWVTRKLTENSLPAMFDRFELRATNHG